MNYSLLVRYTGIHTHTSQSWDRRWQILQGVEKNETEDVQEVHTGNHCLLIEAVKTGLGGKTDLCVGKLTNMW